MRSVGRGGHRPSDCLSFLVFRLSSYFPLEGKTLEKSRYGSFIEGRIAFGKAHSFAHGTLVEKLQELARASLRQWKFGIWSRTSQ